MLRITAVLFLSTLLLFSKETCIINFDKEVCGNFEILSSVIVKTKLSKKQLKEKINKPLKQLAFLEDSNLFLIENTNAFAYARLLAKKTFIIYAQANIVQKKEKLNRKIENISSAYHLKDIWKRTKGEGIKIAIIDDGFNLKHEDFKGLKVAFEYDVEQKNLNASPKINIDKHGTQVAGVLFAQHNSIGINGIAPKSELIAIRQVNNVTSDSILAFTIAHLSKADIINCSWNSPLLLEPLYDVIRHIAKSGREGKGTAIVFSAGNSAKQILPYSNEASIDEVIVVGATQSYSNYGKFVDFIIPSGVKSTKGNGYGFFGGTSATAPIISGVLALKMSEYPKLSTETIVNKLKKELDGK